MAQNRKQQRLSANSFYRLGGIEILSMSRDERSGLWKIYLSTPEHYLVSREFDRTVGMYANAPDDVVRQGLMDFSDSIAGGQLSLFKVMDMFIDRCFDESVFDCNTENAVWMCIDYPSYQEVEEMLATYNCRLRWYSKDEEVGDLVDRALFRTPNGSGRSELASARGAFGAADTRKKGRDYLFSSFRELLGKFLLDNNIASCDIDAIIVSGMAGSELGLCDVAHAALPSSEKEMAQSIYRTRIDEITDIPFIFVRGLKKTDGENNIIKYQFTPVYTVCLMCLTP